ncbi:MAG: CHAT domain-containing protein, partial [Saprospiraceae bacterium]|nr:CHAT domain-containing protein [Saprospiraceae bacterium]
MKFWVLCFIALISSQLTGQTPDSIAIKQVDSLVKVALDLNDKNDFDKALEVIADAEKIALEKLGRETLTYGNCTHHHARLCSFKGDYSEAVNWYLIAIKIREKLLGKESMDYVKSIGNLGAAYWALKQYNNAEKFYLESKEILNKVKINRKHDYEWVIWFLNNFGRLYWDMGMYEKSEPLYLEAMSIRKSILGTDHPDYAASLNGLGNLYFATGLVEKAEPFYLEAKSIRERILGKEHPDYFWSLNNLGSVYWHKGQYEKAEKLYLEAFSMCEKTFGNEHPNYATCLNNLSNLYEDLGQFKKAEHFYIKAKLLREKNLGKNHPDYAGTLINLGALYHDLGQYKDAELNLLEAKEIFELEIKNCNHPFYFNCLSNLANVYVSNCQYEKAESLYMQVISIQESLMGKEHPDYALGLYNLSNLYQQIGKYETAKNLSIEANEILSRTVDNKHPYYETGLSNLAHLFSLNGDFIKAEQYYRERAQLNQLQFERGQYYLSELELGNYMNHFLQTQAELLSFTQIYDSKLGSADSYDNSLFYKGFILQTSRFLNRASMSDSTTSEELQLLKSIERKLSVQYSKPISDRDSAEVADLESKANVLEKELIRKVFGLNKKTHHVKWQEIQNKLKPTNAALEFVHFRYYDKRVTNSTMYAALLILPGIDQPKFIPLFEEKSLDSLLNSKSERKADFVNGLYTLADRGAMALEMPKKSLHEILWKPLEKELKGIKIIYFAPSGLLHRINLDAIPVSEAETLADKYQLIELNSTRQLVIPDQIKIASNDAVLYGGIQYEQDSSYNNREPLLATRTGGEFLFSYVDSTLRGGSWNYLAGTEREVNAIEKIMQTNAIQIKLKKGYDATEESFKNIGTTHNPSPRILHIATHGYFFADPKSTNVTSSNTEPVFKISDHPMLRSGLIMAGGNVAWQGKQTLEGREDGILTAYEISQMNLSNTELVVLSA